MPPQRSRSPVESSLALINVVFLLLLFFLTTGTVVHRYDRSIDPPSSILLGSGKPPVDAIYIDAEATVSFDGRIRSLAEIARTVRARAETGSDGLIKPVQVVADRELKAKVLLAIVAELKELGLQSLTIVTVKDDGS